MPSTPPPDGARITRAQPWLGTFVQVHASAPHTSQWSLMRDVDAAFAEIAAVHRLLSRQEHGVDLARFARAKVGDAVTVDPRTAAVLRIALQLQQDSEGRFVPERRQIGTEPLSTPAWEVLDERTVRVLRAAELDLDGIAKGYAVDRAVELLEARGIAATVNAGGDLRTTAGQAASLHVRCPQAPGGLVVLGKLVGGAFASSQAGPPPAAMEILAGDGIEERRVGAAKIPSMTVSVAAPACVLADALTKIVAIDQGFAIGLLARHAAAAWIFEESDGLLLVHHVGESPLVTPEPTPLP